MANSTMHAKLNYKVNYKNISMKQNEYEKYLKWISIIKKQYKEFEEIKCQTQSLKKCAHSCEQVG